MADEGDTQIRGPLLPHRWWSLQKQCWHFRSNAMHSLITSRARERQKKNTFIGVKLARYKKRVLRAHFFFIPIFWHPWNWKVPRTDRIRMQKKNSSLFSLSLPIVRDARWSGDSTSNNLAFPSILFSWTIVDLSSGQSQIGASYSKSYTQKKKKHSEVMTCSRKKEPGRECSLLH